MFYIHKIGFGFKKNRLLPATILLSLRKCKDIINY